MPHLGNDRASLSRISNQLCDRKIIKRCRKLAEHQLDFKMSIHEQFRVSSASHRKPNQHGITQARNNQSAQGHKKHQDQTTKKREFTSTIVLRWLQKVHVTLFPVDLKVERNEILLCQTRHLVRCPPHYQRTNPTSFETQKLLHRPARRHGLLHSSTKYTGRYKTSALSKHSPPTPKREENLENSVSETHQM